MSIPIEHENDPDARGIHEQCCFCWKPTPWWTNLPGRKPGEQVACCTRCAEEYRVKDVPSKRYWCDMAGRFRNVSDAAYSRGRTAVIQDRCKHTYRPGHQFSALWFVEVCTKCNHEKRIWIENHP